MKRQKYFMFTLLLAGIQSLSMYASQITDSNFSDLLDLVAAIQSGLSAGQTISIPVNKTLTNIMISVFTAGQTTPIAQVQFNNQPAAASLLASLAQGHQMELYTSAVKKIDKVFFLIGYYDGASPQAINFITSNKISGTTPISSYSITLSYSDNSGSSQTIQSGQLITLQSESVTQPAQITPAVIKFADLAQSSMTYQMLKTKLNLNETVAGAAAFQEPSPVGLNINSGTVRIPFISNNLNLLSQFTNIVWSNGVKLVLLAFDTDNNFIPDLEKISSSDIQSTRFRLFLFDAQTNNSIGVSSAISLKVGANQTWDSIDSSNKPVLSNDLQLGIVNSPSAPGALSVKYPGTFQAEHWQFN